MHRLLLTATFAISLFACAPSFEGMMVSINEKEETLELMPPQPDSGACGVLDSNVTATLNGVRARFDSYGGGSCRSQPVLSRQTLGPPINVTEVVCDCAPALLAVKAPATGLELEVCDAPDHCARVIWPAAKVLPTFEVAPSVQGETVVLKATPAYSGPELFRMVKAVGPLGSEGEWSSLDLQWLDGVVMIPARFSHYDGFTVKVSSLETLTPICAGFGSCEPQTVISRAQYEVKR